MYMLMHIPERREVDPEVVIDGLARLHGISEVVSCTVEYIANK